MKDIYGAEIGTTIPFRRVGSYSGSTHEARHPWPPETQVSAGNGVVIRRDGQGSYRTLFMEVYPPGASFIRGEGSTPAECEDACWRKYQAALVCPGPTGEHEWEPRKYRNGAGFCKHCGTFKYRAFTGEQLGQFCHECGQGTTWSGEGDVFGCEAHPVE